MKKYNVAVLGATGAVGQEMMKILEERSFPIAGSCARWASARSAGKTVTFRGQAVKVQEAVRQQRLKASTLSWAPQRTTSRRSWPRPSSRRAVCLLITPRRSG